MLTSCKRAGKLLRKLDIFGYPISLSSDRKTVHNTKFGGCFSFLLLSFFLIVGIVSFYKLFALQLVESNSFAVNLGAKTGCLNLGTDFFMVAVKTNVDLVNNWTNPFFNVTLSQNTQARVGNNTLKYYNNINLTPCTARHFPGLESQYEALGLVSALCPVLGSNLSIQGGFVDDIFTYLKLEFSPCNNSSLCQNQQNIENSIGSYARFAVDFYVVNNDVSLDDLNNPIIRQINSDMHFLVNPMQPYYKTADIFLSDLTIETDYSYFPSLTSSSNILKTHTFKKEIQEQTVFTYDKNAFADFYFRKSQVSYQTNMNIGKFLEILSYLGGIWSTCYIAFLIFLRTYARNDFVNKLANKLYDYPSEKKKKNVPLNTSQSKDQSTHIGGRETIIQKIENHLSFDRKLKIGFMNMIKYILSPLCICFKKNDQLILMKKSEDNIKKDLDIYTILRKIHELDAMRKVLFSDEQQLLLKFCPKRIIDLNKMSQSLELKKFRRKSKVNFLERELQFDNVAIYQQLLIAWSHLKASNERTGINNRIIKMFDEGLRTIFSTSTMSDEQHSRLSLPVHNESSLENFEEIDEKSKNHELDLENYQTTATVRILIK